MSGGTGRRRELAARVGKPQRASAAAVRRLDLSLLGGGRGSHPRFRSVLRLFRLFQHGSPLRRKVDFFRSLFRSGGNRHRRRLFDNFYFRQVFHEFRSRNFFRSSWSWEDSRGNRSRFRDFPGAASTASAGTSNVSGSTACARNSCAAACALSPDMASYLFHRHRVHGLRHRRRNCCRDLVVGQTGGALEPPPQFAKSLAAASISALRVNVFQVRGKFRCSPVVARAQHKVQKLFQGRRVHRGAPQNRFQQSDRFLRQSIAGEQIHVRQRLRDKSLCFFVQLRFSRDHRCVLCRNLRRGSLPNSGRNLGRFRFLNFCLQRFRNS